MQKLLNGIRFFASKISVATLLSCASFSVLAQSNAAATAVVAPAPKVALDTGNVAWMLVSTVLVLLMTIPGIMLFYSGMLRTKNALSLIAHTLAASAVVTLVWVILGYSLAFTDGGQWLGGFERLFVDQLLTAKFIAHISAPTVPESVFCMFQMAFAIIAFAILIGATAERMRLGITMVFAAFWTLLVYAPIAHWVWQPTGWLAKMGHMDFAGGTVVHIAAGASGLAAALVVGPRRGFGTEPMLPHNLLITVLGAGLLWAGWFGFNAGSAFEASSRAAGAILSTQIGACAGAFVWGLCEYIKRGQMSVLGLVTGAIAGLVAITPASGYVGIDGALLIGGAAGSICFLTVTLFKSATGIDDSMDVFALHGIGGLVGTVLVPVFAEQKIAPITSSFMTQGLGALAVMLYAGAATWVILFVLSKLFGLRVDQESEVIGLDVSQHGEMLSIN